MMGMARGVWGFVAPLLSFASAACSLSSGLDDLREGGDAGGATAGSTGAGAGGAASGAAGRPAAGTGGASNAGAAGAGGAAGTGGVAGAGGAGGVSGQERFCQPGVGVLCADFDGADLGEGWQGSFTENFTAIAGCTPGSDGTSRALCVTAQAVDDDLDRSAVYRQSFDDDKPLRCEADIFIATYGGDDVNLISFDFPAVGFDYYSVAIILREGVVVLENYREDDDGVTLPDNSVDLIEAAKLQQGG
jgi:hypothetical protein